MSAEKEENKQDNPILLEDNDKIKVLLDGSDFEGFSIRMLGVVGLSLALIWLSDLSPWLVFGLMTTAWLVYFFYKITRFKEKAYQQIIDDLENQNNQLKKSNQLLQNAIQENMGMRVSTQDKKQNPS
ncbi:MAG: hypothetical protein AAFU64_04420 [Bacteroidota bacterium]